ncbi:MAG TPA: N-acetyl-gamma-glutamyl-phosphate reductase [Clostridia bacterium]|nr:N-acetyl-gamma-glutamyl-phosphate reductase [Clostridia bacterium]
MIKASIVGATGYVGMELLRLLKNHPQVEIAHLASHGNAEEKISDIYPSLKGICDIKLETVDPAKIADSDVVFTALPYATGAETISKLYSLGCAVIDMSADFRYISPEVYKQWYAVEHPHPELLAHSVYGLPELHREKIKNSRLIGNPGCYTTCSILALAPLVKSGLIDLNTIIIDAKSGTSGAGRKPDAALYFCEVNDSFKAYGVTTHRHTSEIEQELSLLANRNIVLSFTPHLLPINRGILATSYAVLNTTDVNAIKDAYDNFYADEPFVQVSHGLLPELKHVVGSNYCKIGYAVDKRLGRIVIVSVIDNLIKGAAGQAIQNMNIKFGIDEKCGLDMPAWYI